MIIFIIFGTGASLGSCKYCNFNILLRSVHEYL